jgi:hypothetical protein
MYPDSSSSLPQKPYKPWLQHQPYELLEPERECTTCHESWPLDGDFWYQDSKNPKGFTTQCKACLSEKKAIKSAAERLRKNDPEATDNAPSTTERTCVTCKVIKPLNKTYFRVYHGKYSGFSSQCKACRNVKALESGVNKQVYKDGRKALRQAESGVIKVEDIQPGTRTVNVL